MNDKIDLDWAPVGSLQNKLVLRRNRTPFIIGLVAALLGLAASIYFRGAVSPSWLFGLLIVLFILTAVIMVALFLLTPSLKLNRDGFEEISIRGNESRKWADVSGFATVAQNRVAFYHLTDASAEIDGQEKPEAGRLRDGYGATSNELLGLMRAFRNRSLEESGTTQKPALAAFARHTGNEAAPADWQAVNELGNIYDVGEERAPWLKWGLSALLLSVVALSGLWLMSVIVNPDSAPKDKIDLVAEKPGEDVPPPKSADEQAWIAALEKDTLEGYREYIEAFPNGRFVDKAQAEIDKYDDKAWATAEQRNTIAGYEDYLADWPEGKYAPKAKERIDEMKKAIEAAKKDAAEKAEAARQAAIARAAQERQAWTTAEAANTVQSYQTYLAGFPSGKNAPEAQARIDRMLADQASAQASAIEEQAWASAKASNTAEGYQTYLSSYPNGKYSSLAKAALEELRPSPGRTYQDCDVCPTMKTLDSGNAQLGAKASEPGVKPNEQPQRPVIISTPFSISINEVSFAQWDACVAAGGCSTRPNDNGWGRGSRPVINVSWDDAQGYAQWLSNKTGKKYSLPSEAQWEYAARGGETGIYMGGSAKALCAFANGAGSESGLTWANKECSDLSSDRTLPVGSLSANKFGLKDMLGNVQEWTLDCNTLNLKDAPTNGDPDLRGSCNQRVVRGGSWFSPPTGLRFTTRENQRRGDSNDFTGFRVVRN